MGDLGADVIKIERPGKGDDTRSWGPPFVAGRNGPLTDQSSYYLAANRNKRSVTVDLANPEGATLIRRLAAKCDVLIENFKTGSLARYGLGYDDLHAELPRLVYCSITGYGQTGPNKQRPGYDLVAQGFGGIMSLTGEADGEPMRVAVGIADVMCGMYAAVGILAALRHRDENGTGQHIDLGLVDSQVAWMINEGTNYLTSKEAPIRRGNQHPNIVPYQVFAVADGHVIVAVGNDNQYRRFCELIGQPELATDARYIDNEARLANRDELVQRIADSLMAWNGDELLAAMEAAGIPGGPINSVPEVLATEQVSERGMRISMTHDNAAEGFIELLGNPLKLSESPVSYRRPPPSCGADTDDVIRELLGEDALEQARDAGLFGAEE